MPKPLFQTVTRGKLLLTGEYFVLDGVSALAVPTRPGQSFQVYPAPESAVHDLTWRAFDERGQSWLQQAFDRSEWMAERASAQVQGNETFGSTGMPKEDPRQRILQILAAAEDLRAGCTDKIHRQTVTTRLQFNRKWGLGSSSTLVAAVSQWLGVDPFALLEATFGGSGYDLACAVAGQPLLYQRASPRPRVKLLNWWPDWIQNTYFVYLNRKQNSRDGIRAYRKQNASRTAGKAIAEITSALIAPTLHPRAVAPLLARHERIVSETLNRPSVQEEQFPDFPGQLKSLGAWGGDFIWAYSDEMPEIVRAYFNARGHRTVIPFANLALAPPT